MDPGNVGRKPEIPRSGDSGIISPTIDQCRNRFTACRHYCRAKILPDVGHTCSSCPFEMMYDPGCGHHVLRKCADAGKDDPSRKCMMTCGKTLPCSHICLKECYLPCECAKCKAKHQPLSNASEFSLIDNEPGSIGTKSADSSPEALGELGNNHPNSSNQNPFGGPNTIFKRVLYWNDTVSKRFQFRNFTHGNPQGNTPAHIPNPWEDEGTECVVQPKENEGTESVVRPKEDEGTESVVQPKEDEGTESVVQPKKDEGQTMPEMKAKPDQEKGAVERSPPLLERLIINAKGQTNPFLATRRAISSSVNSGISLEVGAQVSLTRPHSLLQGLTAILNPPQELTAVLNPTPELTAVLNPPQELTAVLNPTPELTAVLNPTPELTAVLNPPQELTAVLNPTPELTAVLNPTPELTAVLNPTPELTAVLNPPQELTAVLNPTPELTAVLNPPQELTAVLNPPPELAAVLNSPPEFTAVLNSPPELTAVLNPPQKLIPIGTPPEQPQTQAVQTPQTPTSDASEGGLHLHGTPLPILRDPAATTSFMLQPEITETDQAWRLGFASCTRGHLFPSTDEFCDCGEENPFFLILLTDDN